MVHRLARQLKIAFLAFLTLCATSSGQTYNQFPPPGMAYTNHTAGTSVVAGGSFNATGTTIPANGIYLPSANTLGIATNSIQAVSISSAGDATFNSGSLITSSATSQSRVIIGSATGNPSFFEFSIGAPVLGYWGFCGATNDLITGCVANDAVLNNTTATGNVLIGTNNTAWLTINSSGNTVINTNSDNQLKLNALTGGQYSTLAFSNNLTTKAQFFFDNTNNNLNITTNNAGATINFRSGSNSLAGTIDSSDNWNILGNIKLNSKLFAPITAPTISSGFGTSPSIVSNNGPSSFSVNVGTGGVASSGIIGLPAAATGWACSVADVTTPASDASFETGTSTTSVTVTNYVRTTGIAGAWTASDKLEMSCWPN